MKFTALVVVVLTVFYIHLVESKEEINEINSSHSSIAVNPYVPQDHIVNPHDFKYILNPGWNVCQDNVYVIVYVHSAPAYYQRRILIRETWTTRNLFPDIRLVFMLGQTADDKTMQAIKYENDLYYDIVQEDFLDSYRNLSYKGVMALKWISTYCPQARYILKTDDDMIVNTFTLLKHLKFLDRHQLMQNNSIFCLIHKAMNVFRDENIKWYLSEKEYPPKTFPPFCGGSAFILTNDLAKTIYNVSLYVPFLWIDDVYITGLLAKAVNVTFTQYKSLYTIDDELVYIRFTTSPSFYTAMFGHLSNSMNIKRKIWRHILSIHMHKDPEQYKATALDWQERSFQL